MAVKVVDKAEVKEEAKPKVYTNGLTLVVEPGTKAGDYLPKEFAADLVVRNGTIKKVSPTYPLQEHDELVVTPRGVAG